MVLFMFHNTCVLSNMIAHVLLRFDVMAKNQNYFHWPTTNVSYHINMPYMTPRKALTSVDTVNLMSDICQFKW